MFEADISRLYFSGITNTIICSVRLSQGTKKDTSIDLAAFRLHSW